MKKYDNKKAHIKIKYDICKNIIFYEFVYKNTVKKYNSTDWDDLIMDAIEFSDKNNVPLQFHDLTKNI